MPKGKVTEQEIFVMKGMYSDGMSIEDISKELSRSEATIEKYLDIKEEVVEAEAEAEKTETYTYLS